MTKPWLHAGKPDPEMQTIGNEIVLKCIEIFEKIAVKIDFDDKMDLCML